MINHLVGDRISVSELGDIHIPETNEKAARGAVLQPGGDELYIEAQQHRFEAKNHVKAAAAALSAETERLRDHENGLASVNRELRWTSPSLKLRAIDPRARVRWFHVAGATLLALVALGAVVVSNVVLSNYVLNS